MKRITNIRPSALWILLVLATWSRAGTAAPAAAPRATAAGPAVATVGTLRVPRADYEHAAAVALDEYQRTRGTQPSDELRLLIRRQALEQLIRAKLLELEARRGAVPVSEAEIEAEFRTHPFFNENGRFDASRFEKVKQANSAQYRATLAAIRADIANRKLARQVAAQVAPDPAKLQAEVERGLTRATLDLLALRLSEFDGTVPEPRESDVLDYYRAHLHDFERPSRAELSIIQIGEASSERGRAVADSLIAALHGGVTFEGASAGYGGARTKILVAANDFPAYWRGDAAVSGAVFRRPSGSVLDAPVPGRDGWLVVRVDDVRPAGVAPLREASREIRRLLRENAQAHGSDRELKAMYDDRRGMLKTTAYKVRYAVLDPATITVGEPSAADLESYYRGHLADFSAYDAATAAIRTRPLAEVTTDVRARWTVEHRGDLTRGAAARLEAAWRAGRRDRALEAASRVRDMGPLPLGAPVDTGRAGAIVGDSLLARNGAPGTGVTALADGAILVFDIYQVLRDYVPTFEEYRASLVGRLAAKQAEDTEREAHALFDRDPARWATGRTLYFHEIQVPLLDPLEVPLTRSEVEHYHLSHIDRYSAPQQLRARHILVSPKDPGADADAAARRTAEDLLKRVRAGEDFEELARRYSDDAPTAPKGGDLGFFGRGAMLEEFERAAFALKVGETSGLVKTVAGYHIIKVIDELPMVAEPLMHVYPNVGYDAALEKSERLVRARADSLLRLAHTPAQMRAIAARLKYPVIDRVFNLSEFAHLPKEVQGYLRSLEQLPPNSLLPTARLLKGNAMQISWLDSTGASRTVAWEDVKDQVIEQLRTGAPRRALEAKRAELDSLFAAGWSVDSVATLWGGVEHVTGVTAGKGVVGLGGPVAIDSLVFGGARPPAIGDRVWSGWVVLDRGLARVRVVSRTPPGVDVVTARVDSRRRLITERGLQAYFGKLWTRYPVRILDPELSQVTLPPLPDDAR